MSYYPVAGADGNVVGRRDRRERHDRARRRRREASERALERTQFLADVSAALDASLDYDATLSAVADLAVRRIADWCSIDMVDDAGGLRNVAVAHVDPEKVAMARELQERYPPDLDAPTGAPNVALRTGESELYPELTPDLLERAGADAEQIELMRELGLSSAMVVPLRARGRVLGALDPDRDARPRRLRRRTTSRSPSRSPRAPRSRSTTRACTARRASSSAARRPTARSCARSATSTRR